jgi:hypothetical protein
MIIYGYADDAPRGGAGVINPVRPGSNSRGKKMVRIMWQDGRRDSAEFLNVRAAFKEIKKYRKNVGMVLAPSYMDQGSEYYEVYPSRGYAKAHPDGDGYADTIVVSD